MNNICYELAESLNILSGASSTDSSPEAKNPMYNIETMYKYGIDTEAGGCVKCEPVDDMLFSEDHLLLSTFDSWFEQDSKTGTAA